MKLANIPRMVEDAMSIIKIQKFNCIAGQWYFVRNLWITTSVIVLSEDAMRADCATFLRGEERL
jgi:hypothetical protein